MGQDLTGRGDHQTTHHPAQPPLLSTAAVGDGLFDAVGGAISTAHRVFPLLHSRSFSKEQGCPEEGGGWWKGEAAFA